MSKSGRYIAPRGSSPPWPHRMTPWPPSDFSAGISVRRRLRRPRGRSIRRWPAMKAIGVRRRNGLLAVVHVVGGNPAIVGVVAHRAERGLEMLAVGLQRCCQSRLRADAEPQIDRPRAPGRNRCGDKVDQPPPGRLLPLVRLPNCRSPRGSAFASSRSSMAKRPRRSCRPSRSCRRSATRSSGGTTPARGPESS